GMVVVEARGGCVIGSVDGEAEAEREMECVPVVGGGAETKWPSTAWKGRMPLPGAKQNESGPGGFVVRLRCGAGRCVGCMVPAVAHQRASGTETIGMAPARRKSSSFEGSLN